MLAICEHGLNIKEMSEYFGIPETNVKYYISVLKKKYGVSSMLKIVVLYYQNKKYFNSHKTYLKTKIKNVNSIHSYKGPEQLGEY